MFWLGIEILFLHFLLSLSLISVGIVLWSYQDALLFAIVI